MSVDERPVSRKDPARKTSRLDSYDIQAPVAQRKSGGFLIHWSQVRILPGAPTSKSAKTNTKPTDFRSFAWCGTETSANGDETDLDGLGRVGTRGVARAWKRVTGMATKTLQEKVDDLIGNWIEHCILGDIGQMLRRRSRGNYPVAALLFSVVDLLGGLQRGNVDGDHTSNMVAFIKRYLAKVDPTYGTVPDLLVDMFRHPLLHTTRSRSYLAGRRYVLRSAIYWEEDTRRRRALVAARKAHLVRKRYRGHQYLVINDHVLHSDIVCALELFRKDIVSGTHRQLARNFSRAYESATAIVELRTHPKQKLARRLARQVGRVRRRPGTKAKCFSDE
jgi:hypothetical protein